MTLARAWTPRRVRGAEFLDDPSLDPALVTRSLRDVAQCNRWFGGASAVLAELRPLFEARHRSPDAPLTLLDVGTGAGDIPESARREAARAGVPIVTFGLERTAPRAAASRARSGEALAGDGRSLPFASRSVDVVICSQVLHHFDAADGARLLAELDRVARVRVIVSEIRRAWAAAGGVWLASWALGFHPVSRHDGVVSVLRGFRAHELASAIRAATGRQPSVRERRGYRVTASWSPR